ncbi:hypothetical protein [Paraburkholderia sp. C35]|uniref:hypothetical protein n=1 Tax=Paraburkholderia sp. C35 TaxID=2126993 RepID=UPI000D687A63|nr:hypothetical protein [Paraburkholderia sp. C35]
MFRLASFATFAAGIALAALMSQPAHAGQPAVAGALSANAAAGTAGANSSAAADKVYPPLPTLAMLPQTTAEDDEPLAPKPAAKKRKVRAPVDLRPATPAARLVVSDASRTYLRTIDKQLDLALAK